MRPQTNILIDQLPESVTVNGEEYAINTDFRTSMLFEMMMQDDTLEASEKTAGALQLYYPEIPDDLNAAIDEILWFYGCGKNDDPSRKRLNAKREHNRVYSFEYDDDYIYSAFLNQYGIDLQDIEYLHWWKFRSLFNSLTDDNLIVKIMGYRSMKISNGLGKEQQKFYQRVKRMYELPKSMSEVEKTTAIEEALMNGGDLTGLL